MVHIEIELTLLPTEHGGRKSPAGQGYRPQFYYEGKDWDAFYSYLDADRFLPGDTVRAELEFLSPQYHEGRVFVGMPFLAREGNRVIGYGRVTRIVGLEG